MSEDNTNKNLDEINENSEDLEKKESRPKGIDLFFGEKEANFFAKTGREITEDILKESFILYRIDKKRTKTHSLYAEAKKKEYKEPIEIFGRIDVESEEPTYHTDRGLVKQGMGKLTAHVYLDHLEDLGIVEIKDENEIVTDLNKGDFIGFKGQYYKIYDDGYSQISNKFSWGGDRRFYITITAREVDEDTFRAR